MYPPCPNVNPVPASPGTNVIAFEAEALLAPIRSLALPWPGHQLTRPNGAVTHWTIVNPLGNETTSVPVVTVTVWGPAGAFVAIEIDAVRLVALPTVTLLTVMPEPKLT